MTPSVEQQSDAYLNTVLFASTDTMRDPEMPLDSEWAKRTFLLRDTQLSEYVDRINRYTTSATMKYTDSTCGGNLGLNARPQFTRYADTREPGLLTNTEVNVTTTHGNLGMGIYYSEAIDDNSRNIFLRFGVPQFNYLTRFFSMMFDYNASSVARTGRSSTSYAVGYVIGSILGFAAFPLLATTIWGARLVGMVIGSPSSKYYTMKPTMHVYWAMVNNIVNNLAINLGVIPRVIGSATAATQSMYSPYKIDDVYIENIKKLNPAMIGTGGTIDVYAIAGKAQVLANAAANIEYDNLTNATDIYTARKYYRDTLPGHASRAESATLGEYINHALSFETWFGRKKKDSTDMEGGKPPPTEVNPFIVEPTPEAGSTPPDPAFPTTPSVQDGTAITTPAEDKADESFFQTFANHFSSSIRDGYEFMTLRIEGSDSPSDSFSNSTKQSAISSKLNSVAGTVKEINFGLMGGNVAPVIGDMISGGLEAVKGVLGGVLNGATFGLSNVVLAFLEGGFIDVPKVWEDSSYSPGRLNYNLQLISPYGNPISQLQNIYIPLACLLAGALPRATGKASYNSPFLVEVWDRGRQQIRLGLIDSITITRGTSNLPFTNKGRPLAIDVSFSIADLSSIMHVPISSGGLLDINLGLDEDNMFSNYMAVLAGQGLYDQIYPLARGKIGFARILSQFAQYTSAARWGSLVGSSTPGRVLSMFVAGNNFAKKANN